MSEFFFDFFLSLDERFSEFFFDFFARSSDVGERGEALLVAIVAAAKLTFGISIG